MFGMGAVAIHGSFQRFFPYDGDVELISFVLVATLVLLLLYFKK
jgi:hypothetical protein